MNVNGRGCAWALITVLLGCGGDEPAEQVDGLIRYSRLYSAYDGQHDYQLVVSLAASGDHEQARSLDRATAEWTVDSAFVDDQDYRPLVGARVLTTKRAGRTRVAVTVRTEDGQRVRDEAILEISAASPDEWATADAYFNRAMASGGFELKPASGETVCGLAREVLDGGRHSCGVCHHPQQQFSPCTSLQTARYTDDELMATFARGVQPLNDIVASGFLSRLPMPGCVFEHWHTPLDLDEGTTRGLVWKLRSIAPLIPNDLDLGFEADERRQCEDSIFSGVTCR
ncbi:MAG: hypothetical protein ABW321_06395 [Polyangiales bacterium]